MISSLRLYYSLKPIIPRSLQIALRRKRARNIWESLSGELVRLPEDKSTIRWPNESKSAALITHDVETAEGQTRIRELVAIEDRMGVKSCWNFVTDKYDVDVSLINFLRESGHEIGLHGMYHDGKLFRSRKVFERRLKRLREVSQNWGAWGFRSPSLLYDHSLLEGIDFTWDSSIPAWDPFQPSPGGCERYCPFMLNDVCVELPVTLWQDFTLFEELQMTDIDIWRRQAIAIHDRGGLINVIVHPDYMTGNFSAGLYQELLEFLEQLDGVWITLPHRIADFVRDQTTNKT